MNNKFKILSYLFFIFFIKAQGFCEPCEVNFSFTPEIGFLNGTIVENVWYVNTSYSDTTITYTPTTRESRLDWQLENAFFFGAASDLTFNNKYTVSFTFKNAISGDSGIMEDYDWLNTSNPDYLSRYSRHTNYINTFTQIDFAIKRLFYIGRNKLISIAPCLGFETQNISFSGIGGWRTYDTENWEKIPFENKKVITYTQAFIAPFVSVITDFNFLNYFETLINISAVYIHKLNCIDTHHVKYGGIVYNDRIEDAWKFNAELGFFYKINNNNELGFKGNISFIPDAYGFTYSSTTATTPDYTSMGGLSRFLWCYSVAYEIKF